MRTSITCMGRLASLSLLGAGMLAAWISPASAQPPLGMAPSAPPAVRANENIFEVLTPTSQLQITEQYSRVFECPNRIVRVDGFDPEIITVSALSPNRLRVRGEKAGVTNVVLTDEYDNSYSIEVFIAGDVRHLEAYLRKLFPEASVQAVKLNDSVVLHGTVTEPAHITEIMDVALEFYPKVLNQMRVGGVHQVLLDVRVMEVARTKIRQLGFNFLLNGNNAYTASTPGNIINVSQLSTPLGGPSETTFSGLSNSAIQFALMGSSEVFNGFVDALRNESLLKILAEPKLVTTSGRPATILSGGEFPILVPQSLGTVSIQWREFGVRMEAVPVVLGHGRLRLDVAPEVSERDFSNAVSIQGMVVPGISTRRVNTQVEMRFGETLMIGGLISTRKAGETSKVPFLGELPLVGAAFRSVRYNQSETELLILVTPHMVAPLAPHQVPCQGPGEFTDDPTDRELYFDGMIEVPSYGPECEGCETGYGYGGGGGTGYPSGCGYGNCDNSTSPNYTPQQMIAPEGGLPLPNDHVLPPSSGPAAGMPFQNGTTAPPVPGLSPTDFAPSLPPLPGDTVMHSAPTAEANRPESLGLIDPFKTRIRQGETPVQVETKPIQLSSGVTNRSSQQQ